MALRSTIADTDTLLSPLDKRKIISIAEVAEALGYDSETVRRKLISGAIPGGFQTEEKGTWKIRRAVIEKWWAGQGKS